MNTPESYLSYFTPSQMSHATLESILVEREPLLQRLVNRVRISVLTASKHHSLLIGPRGIGKSHLIALAYYRVRALSELKEKIVIAWLAEEEWSVASLADLFLIILKSLDREYPDRGLAAKMERLYYLSAEQVELAAGEMIHAFVGNTTLLLLIENLEEIFRGLGPQGQWALRSYLSEHPFATLIATSPSLFTGIHDRDQAFYGFFNEIHLKELTTREASELLCKVAERRGDHELSMFLKTKIALDRVRAVHDLAGGHPRIYLLFAHLITDVSLDELVTPFLKLLDELTPYYQSRMQLLSPQQRKITEYLCDCRGAVTVKEIAARCFLKPPAAAAQLGDLERMQYVRKTPVGRESHYELREPLLRMVFEVKRGRGEPIRLVVDFLRRWYSRNERRQRLAQAPASAELTHRYLEAALDLKMSQQDMPNSRRARELSVNLQSAFSKQDLSQASDIAAEIIERKGRGSTTDDWLIYAYCLSAGNDTLLSLNSYDKVIEIDSRNKSAWNGRGIVFGKLREFTKALESFDKALEIDPADAPAWSNRGISLYNMRQYAQAVESYDKALEIDPTEASTWTNRGISLYNMQQYAQAVESFDKALEIDPTEASTWSNRGISLYNMRQYAQAVESYDKALEIDPADAPAWSNRGISLYNMQQYAQAVESYDKAIVANREGSYIYFNRSETLLSLRQWNASLEDLERGFALTKGVEDPESDTETYCRILYSGKLFDRTKIQELVTLYATHKATRHLGDGLVQSIPALFDSDGTAASAESWLDAWTAAGADKPELTVALRLLAAAVAWKPKHDPRALLALAIEERRILESLLPKAEPA